MLLKAILFIALTYYAFKLAFRYLLPFFITDQARKMHNRQEKAQRDYINQRKSEEGKITIEYGSSNQRKKKHDNQKGEYVDFEEIK